MRSKRLFTLLAILTLLISLTIAIPIAHGDDPYEFTVPEKQQLQYPNLGSHLNYLVTSVEDGGALSEEAAKGASIHSEESVAVTVYLSGNVDDVVQFLEDNGGDPRNIGEDYIETYFPVNLLGQLSEQPGVIRVREIVPPQPEYGPITSQGVQTHRSAAWNQAGYTGQGVKVGVIDSFGGLRSLMGTELPTTVVGRCYTDIGQHTSNLAACDSDSSHGTAVTEAIVDVAPDVSLYIANPTSLADLQSAADWMVSQGVSVINRSASYPWFDGPGDGTSYYRLSELNIINRAVGGQAVWVNSSGNYATQTWFEDSPVIHAVSSSTSNIDFVAFDGFNDIFNGVLGPGGNVRVILRWDDTWRGASSDLDLLLWDNVSLRYVARSEDYQTGQTGQIPLEIVDHELVEGRLYHIVVIHRSGSLPDWIQAMVRGPAIIEHYTKEGSINNPSESSNAGMLAVGATHYWDTSTIADYSSQGPTPDGRFKPDIVGTACAETASYEPEPPEFHDGNDCWFAGTSQAAPHVAGMAALVRQKFPDYTPQQVAQFLKDNVEERGDAGPDNTWGHGFAVLPPLTADECGETLTGDGTVSGTWAAGCASEARSGTHARYYTFALASESEVAITLESGDADTYLYLREGEARSGAFLYENDDDGGTSRSKIEETLTAGTYTIEATTYGAGETGSFTLTIAGLGGATPTPGPDPGTDECGTTLPSDDPAVVEYVFPDEQWASGCESEERSGSYARYYTFALASESEVAITLESGDADTYLYLREGEARSGAFLYENDDDGGTSRSKIEETLTAGTYTIEATTYGAGETGSFTLTIAGLGGATPTPGPDPGTDECGTTLPSDDPAVVEYVFPDEQWASGCESEERSGSYARYYTFALASESEVAITLESGDADTYLYLREGEARSGAFLYENDDDGGTSRSKIEETLTAGTYTIEATTYGAGETGSFTLTIAGLGGATPTPGPDPGTDECGTTLPSDDPAVVEYVFPDEQWASGCESEERSGSYARYYTFALASESEVAITLESGDADTYLYLREGEARSGTALHENDDHDNAGLARSTDSQIRETLPAGTYTIEATTYGAGETGSFTLTISGLGGTAGTPQAIVFAEPNWDSVQLQTFIARYISEKGYGYPTRTVFGASRSLIQGLASGDAHVLMEVWLPNHSQTWDPALEAGDVLSLGTSLGSDWQSAFVIPAYLQQQYPGLDSVQDLKEQRYKSLFATAETGGKARLVSCVPGWGCAAVNADQVAGYGLDEHVHIVNPGSQDDLFASINGAYQRREPWLGYMWGTSGPALLLDLVRLEEPPYSAGCWESTRACAYQDDTILIGAHSGLPDQAPEVAEFLRKWDFDTEVHLRSVTRWQAGNPGASIEDTGLYWLRNNVDAWSGWVTSEAAARIRSALSSGTSDRAALISLYNATDGANWTNNSGWLTDAPLGEWYGIETDESGRVVGIDLRENSLSGQIPGDIGELGSLRYLYLSNTDGICDDGCEPSSPTANRLPGPIPSEMSKLANLKDLRLAFIQLSGSVPAWMGELSNLQILELTANELSRNIPEQLGNLTNLTFLTLGHNRLTGTMPATIGNLTGLEVLTLHDNQLTGSIPSSYGSLSNLKVVFLFSGNQLTGCIPAGLQRVPRNDFAFQLPFCSQ